MSRDVDLEAATLVWMMSRNPREIQPENVPLLAGFLDKVAEDPLRYNEIFGDALMELQQDKGRDYRGKGFTSDTKSMMKEYKLRERLEKILNFPSEKGLYTRQAIDFAHASMDRTLGDKMTRAIGDGMAKLSDPNLYRQAAILFSQTMEKVNESEIGKKATALAQQAKGWLNDARSQFEDPVRRVTARIRNTTNRKSGFTARSSQIIEKLKELPVFVDSPQNNGKPPIKRRPVRKTPRQSIRDTR